MLTVLMSVAGCPDTTVNTSDTPGDNGSVTARICAEAVELDGTFVPAAIYHNDVPFSGDCVNVDPAVEHVIRADETVGNLHTLNPSVTIAANELQDQEVRPVRFLYKSPDMRFLTVITVGPFGKRVNGLIKFDGREVGVGEAIFEYDPSVVHRISFGDLDYLVTPDDIVVVAEEYADGFVLEEMYDATEDAVEVCFYPRNAETGEIINVFVQVNAVELDEGIYCRTLSSTAVIRANAEHRAGFTTPIEFKIPPNVLTPGASYEFELVYETDVRQICVDTTPVLGEVFLVDNNGVKRSIGWPLDDEYACAYGNPERVASVAFGDVEGFETAPSVEELAFEEWYYETVIGFYNSSTLALACIRTETDWGWIRAQVTIDGLEFKSQYHQWACQAVDPTSEHVITWGPPDYDVEYYIVPDPIIIPANSLVAGERYDYIDEYISTNGGSAYRKVRLSITNGFGHPQRVRFTTSGLSYYGHEYTYTWNTNDVPEAEFVFQDEPYLITPASLVIDLTVLAVNDPNYNLEEDLWEFGVRYYNAEPSAWVCAQALNHEGVVIETWMEFDSLEAASYADHLQRCRVLPVGSDHLITFGGQAGYRAPGAVYIPANKLAANSAVNFIAEYVLENRSAELCLGTNGVAGEIFLNGRSLGWPAILGVCQVRAMLDITRLNTVSVSNEAGFITPSPVVFDTYALGYLSYTELIFEYN